MECNEGFENVRGDICLENGPQSNEYVPKLVSLLFDIDDGINWQKNFKNFEAAQGTHMTVEEIFTILDAKDDQARSKAFAALEQIFTAKEDQYCLQKRFRAEFEKTFTNWD